MRKAAYPELEEEEKKAALASEHSLKMCSTDPEEELYKTQVVSIFTAFSPDSLAKEVYRSRHSKYKTSLFQGFLHSKRFSKEERGHSSPRRKFSFSTEGTCYPVCTLNREKTLRIVVPQQSADL